MLYGSTYGPPTPHSVGVEVELGSLVPHIWLPLPDGSCCWGLKLRIISGALHTSRGASIDDLLTMTERILCRVSGVNLEIRSAPG